MGQRRPQSSRQIASVRLWRIASAGQLIDAEYLRTRLLILCGINLFFRQDGQLKVNRQLVHRSSGGTSAGLFLNPQVLEQCYALFSIISFQQIVASPRADLLEQPYAGPDLDSGSGVNLRNQTRQKGMCPVCCINVTVIRAN